MKQYWLEENVNRCGWHEVPHTRTYHASGVVAVLQRAMRVAGGEPGSHKFRICSSKVTIEFKPKGEKPWRVKTPKKRRLSKKSIIGAIQRSAK